MKHGKPLCGWTAVVVMIITTALPAAEMYSWTDENGVRHFSNTPPPSGQEATITDIPNPAPVPTVEPDAPDPESTLLDPDDVPAGGGDENTELSAADQRRQELAERRATRRSAQAELDAACTQARRRLAQIEPSRRVFYTNEAGETVRMDDEERVGEVETLNEFLDNNCD